MKDPKIPKQPPLPIVSLTLFVLLGLLFSNVSAYSIYIPVVTSVAPVSAQRTINIPYFNVSNVIDQKGAEMGILWFGKVTPSDNYTDIRIGYSNTQIEIQASIIDRLLWYDASSQAPDLKKWDAVAVTLQIDGTSPSKPTVNSYQFVSGLYVFEDSNTYKKSYRGNGTIWLDQSVQFSISSVYRGLSAPNEGGDSDGWAVSIKIPFSSLNIVKPDSGTLWKLGVTLYDRDALNAQPLSPKTWPENSQQDQPSSWGQIRFGMPAYTLPALINLTTTTIRQGLNGAVVPDTDVGGSSTCSGDFNRFSVWGLNNFNTYEFFNVQNQADMADFPCYSKYFVEFPLSQIPAGKTIKSARLQLVQFGNSDPANASPSLIQAFSIVDGFNVTTLNWNNAPTAYENIGQTWVGVITTYHYPGDTYNWDVTRGIIQAYQRGNPARLALYSSDSMMHSGKYFISSDANDGDALYRPTLIVEWGDLK